jgi:formate dehydrogenase subunit delta
MSPLDHSTPEVADHGISTSDKLVRMANQIGSFFLTQNKDEAAAKIADHIVKYWDPRMRGLIIERLNAGGTGLEPTTRQAVEKLRSSS